MSARVISRSADGRIGRNDLGSIMISDDVVAKIASRVSIDVPRVGAAQTRVLGLSFPGADSLGGRATDLSALPRASARVDGSRTMIDLEVAVLWGSSVREVTEQLRERVIVEVNRLCGLEVREVRISVVDFAGELERRPTRVR